MLNQNKSELELLKDEIMQLKSIVEGYKDIIEETSAPFIPSIIPRTFLVPIAGTLSAERLETIVDKIVKDSSIPDIDNVIVDVSGISKQHLSGLSMNSFGNYINKLKQTLTLMGIETYFVGISPDLAREASFLEKSFLADLKSFLSFKEALKHLMKKEGYVLQRVGK
ncbi:rsbT co-antagonist protein RsbR [Peribacillus deserti]|uniref:RsbT co-antagonist protein RsbR n=1 Tax=Peribacillus deserti TaxID=673318 RepID=A0ABS2QL61_9BACI|nr:STAS domain-containing protein [Peribacillus deserti]MBM7693907.1 rsbT co-antagonist protein RsbR [Peribacillus deserti]